MTPMPDLAAASPEVVPSLAMAAVRMVLALGVLILAAWALLRWRNRTVGGRRDLQVLDRAVLTRGASVALVNVSGRRLLLGVSTNGVNLLTRLETPGPTGESFGKALDEASRTREATP